ncbi:MAG: 16S rRNA (guanine(966)-N(2))-methyltransferase RsmD [Candidatus Omnitrophica bacterium]|nr:16S rRNA (guanine(966)-N(2))-methyltransferase RsmD [Candidatus Omnitrophota bacterium]MBU1047122.1 16S rRNA (guanine(966)-N(2))-methyltransferase RsmD [Candidatus Omnitrophota bacterium]MBU1630410.1 16S rRNA (guanine(966)-N(2))-methyltransferase RsmD [Candidatus Omnitrophota bacterium]MBU1889600.1 16S rRNA (guanine(966)-N(2))-methyltransferase RsmD [Candidatus Omnitrophota bacterium]
MRISSGEKKGRVLKCAQHSPLLRPITDKIKNAIFSILFDRVINAQVLDMFAGTGIFGFEALSRGAENVTFVDKNYKNIKLIRENARKLQLDKRIAVLSRDFEEAMEYMEKMKRTFSIVFIDPPYNSDFAFKTLTHASFSSLIKPESLVIARVHHKTNLPVFVNNLPASCGSKQAGMSVIDERKYGEAKVYFYKPTHDNPT